MVENLPASGCVSERQAEAFLGLGERTLTVRRHRRQPIPPHVRMGSRVLYPVDLLRDWIASNLVTSA